MPPGAPTPTTTSKEHHHGTRTRHHRRADGVARVNFADSQSDAWHQLGQQVGRTMTPDEALEAANMKGWDVRKVPLRADIATYHDADGNAVDPRPEPQLVDVPGKILRTNPITKAPQPLGVC